MIDLPSLISLHIGFGGFWGVWGNSGTLTQFSVLNADKLEQIVFNDYALYNVDRITLQGSGAGLNSCVGCKSLVQPNAVTIQEHSLYTVRRLRISCTCPRYADVGRCRHLAAAMIPI